MTLLIVPLICIVAGIIQNVAGFGAGTIMMLVFPYFYGIIGAASLNQAICAGRTIGVFWLYRKNFRLSLALLPTASYLIASLSVLTIVSEIDLTVLSAAFGVALVVLAGYSLTSGQKIRMKPNAGSAIIAGSVAGILSGLFSLGAPVIALYFLSATQCRDSYMGNLQGLFAITNTAGLCMRIFRGYYSCCLVFPTVIGFLALLLGQWIGSKIAGNLDGQKINTIIYLLVGVSGAAVLVKQFL